MDRARICIILLAIALTRTTNADPALCEYRGTQLKTIPENIDVGSVVEVYETDGNNSEVTLKQEANTYFHLDIESRNITLERELDADNGINTITFEVHCTTTEDSITLQSSISFFIEDVNDNPPIFSQSTYSTDVKEDAAVGTVVFHDVHASDNDKGNNGLVYYKIMPGQYSEHFRLSSDTEPVIILNQTLDYEEVISITLEILAENIPLGNFSSATAAVIFNIQDTNDNVPAFSYTSYSATIQEDAAVGSVLQVNQAIYAEDQDRTKSDIKYFIPAGGEFDINETTGEVMVAAPLSVGLVTIVLLAQEVDNSENTAWAVLQVNVVGTHNKAPIFEPMNYNIIVSEMVPVGATMVTVTAKDDDKVTYGLAMSSTTFEIDNEHGTLHLLMSLDYETSRGHTLEVTATDGVHTATATVEITVIDTNDNNPEVDSNEVDVEISRSMGTAVYTIYATDADDGTVLSYTMVSRTQLFSVDSNGVVTVSGPVEELTYDIYHLLVKVSDDGTPPRETSVWIIVRLPPLGTSPRTTYSTTEAAEVTPAAVILASNNDMIVIVLGVIVGVLLLVIIVLIIFIMRRRIRYKEQLDKAKLTRCMDPKGLVFKQSSQHNISSGMLNFGYDLKSEEDFPYPPENLVETKTPSETEERSDGGTTIQENPFSLNGDTVHYQDDNGESGDTYLSAEESGKLNSVEEIQIQTAVLPLQEDRGNPSLQNGGISTFKPPDTDSSDSSDSSGGSKKDLWPTPTKKTLRFKNPSSESIPSTRLSWQGSEVCVNDRLKSGTKDKPEITVYF